MSTRQHIERPKKTHPRNPAPAPNEPSSRDAPEPRRFVLARRYTKDRARFTEHTEVVLWTCKEFWQETFGKRVDNLKTNNRGVYVLTDVAFEWMSGLRPFGGDTEETSWALMMGYAESYGSFAGGVVRGALESLGLRCAVSAEPTCGAVTTGAEEFKPLGCKFTVRLAAGLGFGGVA